MRMIAWLALLHGSHLSCVAPCAGEIAFLGDAQNKHRRNNKPLLKQFLSFSGRPFKGREERGKVEKVAWTFPEPEGENSKKGFNIQIILLHSNYLSEY